MCNLGSILECDSFMGLFSKHIDVLGTPTKFTISHMGNLPFACLPYLLRSWAYKFFISLAVATVLALHAAYPRPTGTHHKTTDAQTPTPSATSSPVPHVSDLPDSP